MRVMALKRKWSGAESRESKRQRELLPSCRRPLTIKTYCPFPVTTHMRVMALKRKWSGAESRESKRQRELLRSAEATAHITTYFARTACSAVSTSKGSLVSALTDSDWFNCIFTYIGCSTLVTTGTSAESKSLTAPDMCTSQLNVLAAMYA